MNFFGVFLGMRGFIWHGGITFSGRACFATNVVAVGDGVVGWIKAKLHNVTYVRLYSIRHNLIHAVAHNGHNMNL